MRLLRGHKYGITWIDAVQENDWSEDKDIDKLVAVHEKGIKEDLIFVKPTEFYNVSDTGIQGR